MRQKSDKPIGRTRPMKHIFIINPTAGKQDSRQRIYDMAKELR